MIELLIVAVTVTVNIAIISALVYATRQRGAVRNSDNISNKEVLEAIEKLSVKIQKNLLSGALR